MNQVNWWSREICPLPSTEGSLIKSSEDSWFTLTNFIPRLSFSERGKRKRKIVHNASTKRRKLTEKIVRTEKTRIYPTKKQKEILRKSIGTCRFIYNKTIELINKNWDEIKGLPKSERKYIKENPIVSLLTGKGSDFIKQKPWIKETPTPSVTNSIKDAFKARKTCFSLLKQRLISKFELKFRKRKFGGYITIEKKSIQKGGVFYQRTLGKIKIPNNNKRARDLLNQYIGQKVPKIEGKTKEEAKILANERRKQLCDCKIILDRIGRYWLHIPFKRCYPENQRMVMMRKRYVALDPGVRTFQTYFSDSQTYGEIGKNDIQRIYRLCKHLDNLQSRMSKQRSKRKRRMKRAWLRLIQRIKNLVNEVHKKTALFLTRNFQTILLPKFETSNMTLNQNRNISSKTARALLTWAHYRFKTYLESVCTRTNTVLREVTEEYTSKTCGKCGNIKNDLGGNKTYHCDLCGYECDRDINAARNILIKYMNEKNLDPGFLSGVALNAFLLWKASV